MPDKTDFFRQSNNELGMRSFYYSEQSFTAPYSMPHPHIHNQHELYLLTEGDRRYFIGSQIIHVHAGDIIFIPKNTIHRTGILTTAEHTRILINFSDNYVDPGLYYDFAALLGNNILSVGADNIEKTTMLMRRIGEEYYTRQDKFTDRMLKISVEALMISLLRISLPDKRSAATRSDNFIDTAVRYINSHFDMPISLDDMAKLSAMSKSHFSKCFRDSTGMSFGDYLHMTRILNAERLLHDTDMSVTQIAMSCGFNDSAYFSTAFRKKTGMTPLAFRKNSLKKSKEV